MKRLIVLFVLALGFTTAQAETLDRYDIGSPAVTTVFVDPNGDDSASGDSPSTALRTVREAWARIPMGVPLSTGYQIMIAPGAYDEDALPGYWESRYATYEQPIIIQAAQGPESVTFQTGINLFDSRYIYFIDIDIDFAGMAFHCERCDHVLLRRMTLYGTGRETAKFNQSQYIYLEDNDISGAEDNAVDYVAVQYGHVRGNTIHDADDWCIYVKGGSAYLEIEGNRIFDCRNGGFTAGQGTGLQYMVPPWQQYEAYDISFTNNLVHDTFGAGVGVQGGHNILIAYNTFVRVGERSHGMEFTFGLRTCDGLPGDEGRERCADYAQKGAWGNSDIPDGVNDVRIPNRNVYVYNNVLYNPAPYQSADQHFTIFGPLENDIQREAGVPTPTRSDDNLQIRGNIFWNGAPDLYLGIEDFIEEVGCASDNPTCNAAQLLAENAINTLEPQMVDLANGDFRLLTQPRTPLPIPPFPNEVLPGVPPSPLTFAVTTDYSGTVRDSASGIGALAGASAP